MAKKRKEDAPAPGAPAWMATFGDLMNLLLCFFVLLFSMSKIDAEEYAKVAASFNNEFSVFDGGATAIGEGVLVSTGVSQLNQLDEYINSTGRTAEDNPDAEEYESEQSETGEKEQGQSELGQERPGQSESGQNTAGQNESSPNNAGQSNQGQDTAGQSNQGQNEAGQSNQGENTAGQNESELNNSGQNSIGQADDGSSEHGRDEAGQSNQGQDTAGQSNQGQNTAGQNNQGKEEAGPTLEEHIAQIEQAQIETSEQLAEQIQEAVNEDNLSGDIGVQFTTQYVQLTLSGAILFDSGSAELKESVLPILGNIGVILEKYATHTIEIEGHTDNVPMSSGRFANNNELSSARALSVFDFFVESTNLNPAQIKTSGRGEYVPVADNSTPEGRAINRRVEIRIYHELSYY